MIPKAPQLSLCIPTYNRAGLLRESMEAILAQIGPEEAAQVEILVVDNASSDGTEAVIEDAVRQSPHVRLRFVRNAENIGPDRNFLKAITLAQGEFVFLVSDDDILLPGAVAALLAMIRRHPNFDAFSMNVCPFVSSPKDAGPALLDLPEDLAVHRRDDALRLLGTLIGFMSILAFRKSCIEPGSYAGRTGTNFLQSFLFLDVLAGERGFAVAAQPRLAQRAGNAAGLDYFRVFVTGLHGVLAYAEEKGYSRTVTRRIEADNLIAVRHFVSSVKLHGLHADLWPGCGDAVRRLFQVYGFRPYLWLAVVPLMFFPVPMRPLIPRLRRLLGRTAAGVDNANRLHR